MLPTLVERLADLLAAMTEIWRHALVEKRRAALADAVSDDRKRLASLVGFGACQESAWGSRRSSEDQPEKWYTTDS